MLWTTKEYENNIKEYQILILIPGVTQSSHRSGQCETTIARRTEICTAEATADEVLEDDINGSKYNYCFVSVSLQVGDSCVIELAECNACSACEYTFEAQ